MMPAATGEKKSGPRLLFYRQYPDYPDLPCNRTHCSITTVVLNWSSPTGQCTRDLVILSVLDSLNQSFFMGFFVLVSAYFVPGSLLRKGMGRFTRERLVRLGIPLLFWVLVLNPLILLILSPCLASHFLCLATGVLNPVTGGGPRAHVVCLLPDCSNLCVFCGQRSTGRIHPWIRNLARSPVFASIFALGIFLAIITAAVPYFPAHGSTVACSYFQPPFFPQYIVAFIIGIYAAAQQLVRTVSHTGSGRAMHCRGPAPCRGPAVSSST